MLSYFYRSVTAFKLESNPAMKLDILAIGAHPDDVELSCAGTLIKHISSGKSVGLLDLTLGELGTRGDAKTRSAEAADAAKILNASVREQLKMKDGFFEASEENLRLLIVQIRKFQPEIILCNAVTDRHPDHGRAASLVSHAVFLAGLRKIETTWQEKSQAPWKTKATYHYIQDRHIKPDFIVDVTAEWDQKMKSILAYRSQFFNPESKEPDTAISTKDFIEFLEGRAREVGRPAGFRYGEGFTVERIPGINSLFDLS